MRPPGIPTGVHVVLELHERILLMRRCNTGFFDGQYSLPGGHVEPGESIKAAAVREMREELDVLVDPDALSMIGVVHRYSDTNRIDFFMKATTWSGTPIRAEPDKCDDLVWVDLHQLPPNTVDYVQHALHQGHAAPWIAESGWSGQSGYLVY